MSKYIITNYSKKRAKDLGVQIKSSENKKKKIDVFKDKKKILGKKEADKKRKAYKARHEKDRKVAGSNGYYADQILW